MGALRFVGAVCPAPTGTFCDVVDVGGVVVVVEVGDAIPSLCRGRTCGVGTGAACCADCVVDVLASPGADTAFSGAARETSPRGGVCPVVFATSPVPFAGEVGDSVSAFVAVATCFSALVTAFAGAF
jgi:hypothetical protein